MDAYWKITLYIGCPDLTTVNATSHLYYFKSLQFGLSGSRAIFQLVINSFKEEALDFDS